MATVEGRYFAGVYCLRCCSWVCSDYLHESAKRAIYVRDPLGPGRVLVGEALDMERLPPRPHHENVARYQLTEKGRAAVFAYRAERGRTES